MGDYIVTGRGVKNPERGGGAGKNHNVELVGKLTKLQDYCKYNSASYKFGIEYSCIH